MVINLDPWLTTSNWKTKRKSPVKGVDVIDRCLLASKSNKTMGPHPKSPKLSPRKRFPNPKYKEYVVNVPSGYCPKCHKYIKESDKANVVCVKCDAYWHHECVEITQSELDEKWANIDFLCKEHREEKANDEIVVSQIIQTPDVNDAFDDDKLVVRSIKIKEYELNTKGVLKKKLASMSRSAIFEPKDSNRQHTVTMSTPTYHIMLENMTHCGKALGLEVKRDDKDQKGNAVESLFTAEIKLIDDTVLPFALTCYHTTNRMLFQLLGPKTSPKVNELAVFVNNTIRRNVENIERTELHCELQVAMRNELEELLTANNQDSLVIEGTGENMAFTEKPEDPKGDDRPKIANKAILNNQNSEIDEGDVKNEEETNVNPLNATILALKARLDEEHKEKKKIQRENDNYANAQKKRKERKRQSEC